MNFEKYCLKFSKKEILCNIMAVHYMKVRKCISPNRFICTNLIVSFYISGQEIDFLSLLKSFGSDMEKVAKAFGVDMNTLNNMDRDVLLELLTSQSGSGANAMYGH